MLKNGWFPLAQQLLIFLIKFPIRSHVKLISDVAATLVGWWACWTVRHNSEKGQPMDKYTKVWFQLAQQFQKEDLYEIHQKIFYFKQQQQSVLQAGLKMTKEPFKLSLSYN